MSQLYGDGIPVFQPPKKTADQLCETGAEKGQGLSIMHLAILRAHDTDPTVSNFPEVILSFAKNLVDGV